MICTYGLVWLNARLISHCQLPLNICTLPQAEEGTAWQLRRGSEWEALIQSYSKLTLSHTHSPAFGCTRLRRPCRPCGRAIIVKRS
eukprot:5511707-Pyramimonas_sp.AAC.1